MKPKHILYDATFEKSFNKYKAHMTEAQKKRLKQKLEIFKEDVFDKRLKTHKLKGNLSDYYAFSVSQSDRMVFKVLKGEVVYFIEIGGHDVCY